MSSHTLKTTFAFLFLRGREEREVELPVIVSFDFTRGYAETHEEPGCDATVEITAITAPNFADLFDGDAELIAECFAAVEDEDERAREARDEARAEDRRNH